MSKFPDDLCEDEDVFPKLPRVKAKDIFPYEIIGWLKTEEDNKVTSTINRELDIIW